jgi:hypothetical protein
MGQIMTLFTAVFKNLAPEREKQKENTDLPSKWTDAKASSTFFSHM